MVVRARPRATSPESHERKTAPLMKAALLHERDGLRVFVVVLGTGEEVIDALTRFANEQRLGASQFTAIGAFERAVVAYFDWETKRYEPIPIDEQVEVL